MRIVILVGALVLSAGALADGKTEAKYRSHVMGAIGQTMQALGTIARGGVHAENMKAHAAIMVQLAGLAPYVFPKGSGGGESEAKPAVWDDAPGFAKAMDRFVEAAAEFDRSAKAGGDVGSAMGDLGRSCKGCHDDYREEHD